MKHPKRLRERRDLCAHLHEDDGFDAHHNAPRRHSEQRSFSVADRRLCKVALHAVSHTLLELSGDPVLSLMHVHSVTLDRGRMVVLLAPHHALSPQSDHLAQIAIHSLRAPMRAAIARAINRKRTPEVVVHLAPMPLQEEEHSDE